MSNRAGISRKLADTLKLPVADAIEAAAIFPFDVGALQHSHLAT